VFSALLYMALRRLLGILCFKGRAAEQVQRKLRDELLNGEIFYTLKEAQILIAGWRRLYNGRRPHSSLGQRPPAPETIVWPGFSLADYGPPSLTRKAASRLT
jgi:transposase InsO family protein